MKRIVSHVASPLRLLLLLSIVCLLLLAGADTMRASSAGAGAKNAAATLAATSGGSSSTTLQQAAGGPALAEGATNPLTAGLVNLTKSPAQERFPAWSPQGDFVAFVSNGLDQDNDGQIDSVNPTGQYSLFTMQADGTHMLRHDLGAPVHVVDGGAPIVWNMDGTGIYAVTEEADGRYGIRLLYVYTGIVTDPIYTDAKPISAITVSPNNTVFYFDREDAPGLYNIYLVSARVTNGTPTPLTAGPGSNRHPVTDELGDYIVFQSDRSGQWAIYRMRNNGALQVQLTFPAPGEDDIEGYISRPYTDPHIANYIATAYLVFTSTRSTNMTPATEVDATADSNIWTMPYGVEGNDATVTLPTGGTTTVHCTAFPRFYQDVDMTSAEKEAVPHVFQGDSDKVLFVSDQDESGNDDIWFGSLYDTDAPFVTAPAVSNPKIVVPGQPVTVTVPVQDLGTGIRHVWLQVKDPDNADQDVLGQNHVITMPSEDYRTQLTEYNFMAGQNDFVYYLEGSDEPHFYQYLPDYLHTPPGYCPFPTTTPVEYGVLNPWTYQYLDPTFADTTTFADYYAGANTMNRVTTPDTAFSSLYKIYAPEGQGYPAVPAHWMEMYDDGTHGDAVANDGTYTCQWNTPPAEMAGDWYFDVVVEDTYHSKWDTDHWVGNRRRFDNVGGCSTLVNFTGGKRILFVDDYADGQRFLYYGVAGVMGGYLPASVLNSPYYFTRATAYHKGGGGTLFTSPFLPDGGFGGVDMWRIQARGPVPDYILSSYKPKTVKYYTADGSQLMDIHHGEREVVWIAPMAWYRLIGSWFNRSDFTGTGSLIEKRVQDQVTAFVKNDGGRMFFIGADLATGLTAFGTAQNTFLTEVLGVASRPSATLTAYSMVASDDTHTALPGLAALAGWYGSDVPGKKWWVIGSYTAEPHEDPLHYRWDGKHDHYILPLNSNPGFQPGMVMIPHPFRLPWDPGPYLLSWDQLQPVESPNTRPAFACFDVKESPGHDDNPAIVGVSNELPASGARTAFWSFGYEHLSHGYRTAPAFDTVTWLLDGSASGSVAQNNDLMPISNALVTVSSPDGRQWATRTNGRGEYLLQGLRSGTCVLSVVANGYYGRSASGALVDGGQVSSGHNFFLYRDINTCTLWGYITQDRKPVANATVTATALAGSVVYTTKTDLAGRYELPNMLSGPYSVTATHPTSGDEATIIISDPGTLPTDTPLVAGERRQRDIELSKNIPDMLIRNAGETDYIGGDTQDIAEQTKVQVVANTGVAAVFDIQLQNDGNYLDSYTVTGPASAGGWTIDYYTVDAQGNETQVTGDVTGSGYAVNDLTPGAIQDFRLKATPDASVYSGDRGAFTADITAASVKNPAARDTVRAVAQKAPPTDLTFTATPANRQLLGRTVTLTATNVIGGGPVEYRFFARRMSNNELIAIPDEVNGNATGYTARATRVWTPSVADTYKLIAYVREQGSTAEYQAYKWILYYQVVGELSSVSLTADPASPAASGSTISLKATANGGANLEYQFLVNGSVHRDWAASSTCSWKPTVTGTYTLVVNVRANDGTGRTATSDPMTYEIREPLSGLALDVSPAATREVGKPVTLTAIPTNGVKVLYQFRLQTGSSWTVLRDYAPEATVTWTPTVAQIGDHNLMVVAHEQGSSTEFSSNVVAYRITKVLITGLELRTSPASPCITGTPVTLTAVATNGNDVRYAFYAQQAGGTETCLQDFSTGAETTWTPATKGTYTLTVRAKEADSANAYDAVAQQTYVVNPPEITGLTLDATPASPQPVTTPVTLVATPSGGEVVEYQFYSSCNGSPWALQQDWTVGQVVNGKPRMTYAWTPTQVGTYSLLVYVREQGKTGYAAKQVLKYTVTRPKIDHLNVTANPAGPVPVNTPVTITATPIGTDGSTLGNTYGAIEYRFYVRTGSAAWTLVRDYGTSNTCQWQPAKSGTYSWLVYARYVGSTSFSEASGTLSYIVELSGITLTASPVEQAPVDSTVRLTATATGNDAGKVEYKFYARCNYGPWQLLRGYSTANTYDWKPSEVGFYSVLVYARTVGRKADSEVKTFIYYRVTPKLTALSLETDLASPQPVGTSVNLTAVATGGANLVYRFRVAYLVGSTWQWTTLQDYSTSATYRWTPGTPRIYRLEASAREAGSAESTALKAEVQYTINPRPLTGVTLNTSLASPQRVNTPIMLSATPDGGSTVEYEFRVGLTQANGSISWVTIRSYSTAASCNWSTPTAGTYAIQVNAREAGTLQVVQDTKQYLITP